MRSKLFTFLASAILLILSAGHACAQNINYFMPTIFPNAPNTSAFAKYGDYPVNYFSGLPDISIPLYTVEAGGVQMPITLSYHASGNKVSDIASWVGLGWSVNTGGSITRQINGMPDETGYLQGELPNHALDPTNTADLNELYTIVQRQTDTRPDVFTYNIPGHSGHFFFNGLNGYKIQKIPFSPIQIGYHVDIAHSDSLSFTINDEQGNTFLLGQHYWESTGVAGGGDSHYTAVSAWMLEKMISANRRDTVSLSYTEADLTEPPDVLYETCTLGDQSTIVHSCGMPRNFGPLYAAFNDRQAIIEKQLHRITFRNGRVDFVLDPTVRKDVGSGSMHGGLDYYGLNYIQVSIYNYATKQYEVQKTVKFFKTYFGTLGTGNVRLRLDSIQVLDKAGSIIQHYRFKYDQSHILPDYGSLSRDWWGYYNHKQDGKIPNGSDTTSLIPSITVPYQSSGVAPPTTITLGSTTPHNRDCDSVYMQACMLDTIYYPTGGYTTFSYQTNRYLDSASQMHLTGGLRVTSIKSYDGVSTTPIVKTIQYNSSHALFNVNAINPLNYGFFSSSAIIRTWGCADSLCISKQVCDQYRSRTFYAQPTALLEPFDGTTVGYSNVTEYNGTPSANIGRTDYTYNYLPDITSDATASGIMINIDQSYQRGQLLTQIQSLRKTDGTYQVVRGDVNSYINTPTSSVSYGNVGLAVGERVINSGLVTRAYTGSYSPDDVGSFGAYGYTFRSDQNYLTGTTSYVYDTTDPTKYTTSSVTYTYDDTTHQQIVKTTHTDSRGNTHITSNKYAYNYLSGGSTGNPVLDTMLNHNMFAVPIEKWDSLRNAITSVNAVTGAQLTQYQAGQFTGTVVPYKISVLKIISPVTNFNHSHIVSGNLVSDSRYTQMISFDAYDAKNNITRYTPRNATPTGILWNYSYEFPEAQVKNAPSSGGQAYTGFEADSKGGWTYSGTPVADLTAPAGKLVYPLSAGNITNAFYYNTKANVLSYWSNGAAATVTAGGTGASGTAMTTINGWTYYEHTIPAGGGSISISGTMSIDELRLYPIDAQMITYAYTPDGLISIADTKGSVSHFEYDYFQRLKNIKDIYGNIVNNYGYHTYDQAISNDAMSARFSRTTCPPNTTPDTLTYSVPANRYYSSTKASANADATYELNTSGQAKANQNCGCPATAKFTLTNNTGISGYQVTFSGIGTPYNFPTTGNKIIYVPVGTYATVTAGPFGSFVKTFVLGSRTPVTGHSATFSTVLIATSGSTDTSLTINN